jgi:hypothetical protein
MANEPIPSHARPLPAWLKWGLPAAIFLYPAVLIVPSLNWEAHFYREYGLVETLTNLFLLIALVLAVRAARAAVNPLQRAWVVLFALGCFIFLGEEISWGQHYLKWVPPESWAEMNRQNETNLHNIKGWPEFLFSKVARNGLSIGMILGSVIAPWWLRRNPQLCQPSGINFWLWPSSQSAAVAVLAVVSNIPKRLMKNFGVEIPWQYYGPNDGELKECLFALFILLYAIVLFRTLREQAGR